MTFQQIDSSVVQSINKEKVLVSSENGDKQKINDGSYNDWLSLFPICITWTIPFSATNLLQIISFFFLYMEIFSN